MATPLTRDAVSKPAHSMASSAAAALFARPVRGCLLRVWQFAGPSCCFKSSTVASGSGPVEPSVAVTGLLGNTSCKALPWEEWWPTLVKRDLSSVLYMNSRSPGFLLDHVWVTIRACPSVVNKPTPSGRPLIVAIRLGHRGVAELLHRCGATLHKLMADELLCEAACHGTAAVISLLLYDSRGCCRQHPWACPNARQARNGGTALDVAVTRGHSKCSELLRRAGARHSLHRAAKEGHVADLTACLHDGAFVDEGDRSGASPLWHVVRGHGRRASNSEEGAARSRCVDLLLEARASVDVLPITLETPLSIAAFQGDLQLCQQLLKARANPLAPDRRGCTPIQRASCDSVKSLLGTHIHHVDAESTIDSSTSADLAYATGGMLLDASAFVTHHGMDATSFSPFAIAAETNHYGSPQHWMGLHSGYAPHPLSQPYGNAYMAAGASPLYHRYAEQLRRPGTYNTWR